MNGTIELSPYESNMDETWMIESNCENIRIWSELFETTKGFDFLWIGENEYNGNDKINQTMTNNSTIRFKSNRWVDKKGFKLIWNCEKN